MAYHRAYIAAMVMPTNVTAPDPGEPTDAPSELTAPRLSIPQSMVREIVDHLRAALPNEGCGLIASHRADDREVNAARFFPGTNADNSQVRFSMDAAEVVAAFKLMRQQDQELAAIVHSHPVSEAEPVSYTHLTLPTIYSV